MGFYFVNLPCRYIAEDRAYLDFFLEKAINPELGLDAISLESLDDSWHKNLAATLAQNGLSCSIHLPFHDLQPGSIDDLILQASRDRLKMAMQVASIYEPVYLVGHANFIPLYSNLFSKWLNRAVSTWERVLDAWSEHPPLYLENVREYDPRPLSDLLSELSERQVKFCFDLGHWSSYGGGSQYQNLPAWIQTLSPFLAQLHLHDNDGVADQHLGLGQGTIPWLELFAGLEFLDLVPGLTLEPHSLEDLENSWSFIRNHISWFNRLGLRMQDLPL